MQHSNKPSISDPGIDTSRIIELAPGLQRVTAPNPSFMTGPGTNSYVVGHGPYAIIDPGVAEPAHLQRLLTASAGGRVDTIYLTHRHHDHVGGIDWLVEQTGARVRAWPKKCLADADRPVQISRRLRADEALSVGGITMIARHTPGHASDHVVFELPELGVLLAGDTLMTGATVVILPPDGHMGDYLQTLEAMQRWQATYIAPGHGTVMSHVRRTIAAAGRYQRERERKIMNVLTTQRSMSTARVTAQLYPNMQADFKTMMTRQVQAHLEHLAAQERVEAVGRSGWRRRR